MSLIVENALKSKFAIAKQRTAVYAIDGTYLGMFDPTEPGEDIDLEPEISREELMRRLAESGGRGRKLSDILDELKAGVNPLGAQE